MGFWAKLFGSRKPKPETKNAMGVPARVVDAAPPWVAEQRRRDEALRPWLEQLKVKKDYAALIVGFDDSADPQWNDKRWLAKAALKEAGSEAVPALLEYIAQKGYCGNSIAELLVEIGDPRAVPPLKKKLPTGGFRSQVGLEDKIVAFIEKFDSGVVEERRLALKREEEAADARLDAPAAEGVPLREYSTAYIFRPAAAARRAFSALQTATRQGHGFPLNAPHQIALVHGPAADFVAVLVRLPTEKDEGVALHRRLSAWFVDAGAGTPDDYESLNAPLPGRLSRGLRDGLPGSYSVLEIVDKL